MSCPGGSPSISALAVKSLSGSASTKTAPRIILKLSVVATSTCMRDGRSDRAQTTPKSIDTSPDWTPWVIDRPVGRAAEIGLGDAAERSDRQRRRGRRHEPPTREQRM